MTSGSSWTWRNQKLSHDGGWKWIEIKMDNFLWITNFLKTNDFVVCVFLATRGESIRKTHEKLSAR